MALSLSIDVEVFRVAAVVKVRRGPRGRVDWVRSCVSSFSDESRRRLVFAANNADAEWGGYAVATYPNEWPSDGRRVKEDLHRFLKEYREEIGGKYFWGLEFQERGAPHFNYLFDKFVPIDWFSEAWFRAVGSGDEKHLRCGTSIESLSSREECVGYMASTYLGKKGQKEVPEGFEHVGRFWGMSRGILHPVRSEELEFREGLSIIRGLRKYLEKELRVQVVQPERDGVKRSRKVHRKRKGFLHQPRVQGLTIYKGGVVAGRLLDSV